MKNKLEALLKEFDEKFIKQGKYGDLPIPPAVVKSFIAKVYDQTRQEAIEEVLKIINDNDPQTDNKVSPHYWGKTLRKDIQALSSLKDKNK